MPEDKIVEHDWVSVEDKLPEDDKPVETKIDHTYDNDWCYIKRKHVKGIWYVCDAERKQFDDPKYNPTHWHA